MFSIVKQISEILRIIYVIKFSLLSNIITERFSFENTLSYILLKSLLKLLKALLKTFTDGN